MLSSDTSDIRGNTPEFNCLRLVVWFKEHSNPIDVHAIHGEEHTVRSLAVQGGDKGESGKQALRDRYFITADVSDNRAAREPADRHFSQ